METVVRPCTRRSLLAVSLCHAFVLHLQLFVQRRWWHANRISKGWPCRNSTGNDGGLGRTRTVLAAAQPDLEVVQGGGEAEGRERPRIVDFGALLGGPPAEDVPEGAVGHVRRVGVEVVLDARCQRALWSEQGDLDVVGAHACRGQGTLLYQYWVRQTDRQTDNLNAKSRE